MPIPVVVTTAAKLNVLALLATALTGAWDEFRVILFKNDITPDEDTVYDDLEIADFSGYAAAAAQAWQAPFLDFQDGPSIVATDVVHFVSAGGAPYVPGVAYGYAVVLPNGPTFDLLFAARFASLFNFDVAGRDLAVLPQVPFTKLIEA